jgi:hypothetical protein
MKTALDVAIDRAAKVDPTVPRQLEARAPAARPALDLSEILEKPGAAKKDRR